MIYSKGKKIIGEFARMIKKYYGISKKGIPMRNLQVNAIVELLHQVIGKMINTFKIYDRNGLDEQDL